jgi:3-oxoacyl-[acyl-carrier protein] reductase
MSDTEVIALITGASRGIGRAIATELGKNAYTVIGTATTAAGADSISSYLENNGSKGEGWIVDVSSDDSVSSLVNGIKEKYGMPAVLVNNAGITRDNLLMRMKPEEWSAVIDTNLGSMYRVCKACVKGMTKARWGRIINISSVVGSSGNAGQTNYAASKAGIEGFTRALAKEIGSRGITVNALAPGFIDTDMTRDMSAQQAEYMLGQIPLARFGRPEEIASVVAFLASESAAYITGETVHVNGGMYMG